MMTRVAWNVAARAGSCSFLRTRAPLTTTLCRSSSHCDTRSEGTLLQKESLYSGRCHDVLVRSASSLRLFSSTPSRPTPTGTQNCPGGEIYQQALNSLKRAEELEKEEEQGRSKEMFEAWKKSKDAQHNPKTQGVMVVKTLVKETRKAKKRQGADQRQLRQDAISLLEQAGNEYNHPEALVQLGNFALNDAAEQRGSDSNAKEGLVVKAMDLFQRAGMAGSRVGWYNLGQLYWTGYPAPGKILQDKNQIEEPENSVAEQIISPDLHEAVECFTKAIDLGDTDAMYLVGVHRLTSEGRENIHSGLRLVERAAEYGHGGAMYYLALLHLNGEPNVGLEPCELDEFVRLLDRAVEAGSVDAMFTRGHSYYHGTEGYPRSATRALDDFLRAADQGHADSAVSAGAILHSGVGVKQDQQRAFQLYQAAGELGSQEGWQNVVACYTTGEGVPLSLETARYIQETMLKDSALE